MKRLLYYLNYIMENDTTTFRYTLMADGKPVQKEIYDGECGVVYLKPCGEVINPECMGIRREPTYWRLDFSYTFQRTSRMALDKPTVTISIPAERLGIQDFSPAAADFCLRGIKPYFDGINAEYANKARPDSENGKFCVYEPGGEVLLRNTSYFSMLPVKDYENGRGAVIYETKFTEPPPDKMFLCIRIEIQLPHGKLKRAKKMLTQDLPDSAERFAKNFDRGGLRAALELEEKQQAIRRFLGENGYCSFIANGSILPREKNTRLPMKNALPFHSTTEDEIEIAGIKGMGIKKGVTVITGGGYSGKSTLLNAVSAGIYNHVSGDGRELCVTDESAVTITAEDGRAVSCLNISPFIKWIHNGNAEAFTTAHASGSTSQSANIMEAIACGSKLLLIDEDRSATNFMIRDALMRKLIEKEPITPFTDRVRELSSRGVSTVLVIGGSGEYLSVADKIFLMDEFKLRDITEKAKTLAPDNVEANLPPAFWETKRILLSGGFSSYPAGSGTEKLTVSDTGFIIIGDEKIDIRNLHNTATPAQTDALAFILRRLMRGTDETDELEAMALAMRGLPPKTKLREIDIFFRVKELYKEINEKGLNIVVSGFFTEMNRFLELPREIEVYAAIGRMRYTAWKAY